MARDRKSDSYRRTKAAQLGRPILPGHDVDHLNENKDDNTPGNLVERPHGEHSTVTQSPERRSLRTLQRVLAMPRKNQKLY